MSNGMRTPDLLTITTAFRPLIEFIYPRTCFVCESPMQHTGSRVCQACWSTIQSLGPDDPPFREMQRRLTEGGSVGGLISLYHFEKDGTLQSVIHQLKYGGMSSLGVELGRRLGEHINRGSVDAVIPVPLHGTKLRERGYNQSASIAQGIHDVTGIPVCSSLLKRHKYTNSQTQLTAAERMVNVGDAFSLNKRGSVTPEGKTLMLVDDVVTTGATMDACARVLRAAGARSVLAASIAIADHSV